MAAVELTVTVRDAKSVRAEVSGGPEADGEISADKLHMETVDLLIDWLSSDSHLNRSRIFKRRTLTVLGSHLFNLIFSGKIRSLFENCLDNVEKDEQLRVRLSFMEDAERLNDMPWEYLYFPAPPSRPAFFFATELKLILTRYIRPNAEQTMEEEEGPLKVLFVVAQPEGLAPIEFQPIFEAVEKINERRSVVVATLDKPTVETLQAELEHNRPHVLHFLGHSRLDSERKYPEIALLDSDAKTALWLDYSTFATFVCEVRPSPRLVCLQMPDVRQQQEFTANFTRLAPELIKREIPAVVATQYPLARDAAVGFSRAFYEELAQGQRIDYAVQQGRRRIIRANPAAHDDRVFGAPVLYIGRADRIIRPSAPRASVTSLPSGEAPAHTVAAPAQSPEAAQHVAPSFPKLYAVVTAGTVVLDSLNLTMAQKAAMSSRLTALKQELALLEAGSWQSRLERHWTQASDEALVQVLSGMIAALEAADR